MIFVPKIPRTSRSLMGGSPSRGELKLAFVFSGCVWSAVGALCCALLRCATPGDFHCGHLCVLPALWLALRPVMMIRIRISHPCAESCCTAFFAHTQVRHL